jgi:DNA-directed RNA polymerase subunit F
MILSKKPISMIEVSDEVKNSKSEDKELCDFIKKFTKLTVEKAKKIEADLTKLDLVKLNQENIVKIIDFMPENHTDLNKIFTSTTLDDAESKQVLDVIKQYK